MGVKKTICSKVSTRRFGMKYFAVDTYFAIILDGHFFLQNKHPVQEKNGRPRLSQSE
jgi:hypothetical protein